MLLYFCLCVSLFQFPLCLSERISTSNICIKKFESSSTCGQAGPEEFSSLDLLAIGVRQVCDSSDQDLSHPPDALNDLENPEDVTTFTWWQSKNGVEEVSLTLNLEGFFFLFSVRINFKSPLPSAFVLEASQDFQGSFHPLRYFSTDCERDFGLTDTQLSGSGVTREQLICTSDFTDGDEEGGQNLVIFDPSACSDCSTGLNGISTYSLTNLRIRLVRFSSSIFELDDPFLLSYYAIYDINVEIYCICSETLSLPESENGTLLCPCPIPLDLPHNCTPPTSGPLCRFCTPGFYRSALTEDKCVPCDCDPIGSVNDGRCNSVSGQCECHPGVRGRRCDSCAPGYLGPTPFLAMPCVGCFCNGFSRSCDADEGWYQAQVVSGFDEEMDVGGFSSPGEIKYSPEGFLEVSSMENSQLLTLSFPPSYLGDKRTAFGQALTFNLSFPGLSDALTSSTPLQLVKGFLKVVPFATRLAPPETLMVDFYASNTDEPQQAKITFLPSEFYLVSYFSRLASGKTAKGRDIRKALSNIRYLRLSFLFPEEVEASARVLRLHQSSLDFATNNITNLEATSAILPLTPVSYVERCTCPDSREGSHCQSCSEQHTFNPPYGGEFARCVSCFCNFRSSLCDPVGGQCFDCTENTRGRNCEMCLEGYDRTVPVAFAQCDICALSYFNVGNGTCVSCNCDPDGSSSSMCSDVSGQCLCLPRVGGVKCDRCLAESSNAIPFPSCEPCDECTDQFLERIMILEGLVTQAVGLVLDLNNQTDGTQLSELENLFNLTRSVREILDERNVVTLSTSVRSTHRLICELINRTEALVERAQSQIALKVTLESITTGLISNLNFLNQIVSQLESDIRNISSFLDLINISSNFSFFLDLSRVAFDRVLRADGLIKTNFSLTLSEIRQVLNSYRLLNESLTLQNSDLVSQLDTIRLRLDAMETFVDEVSVEVCGGAGRNGNCEGCGGVECETCGASEDCEGLARQAAESESTANLALEGANVVLQQMQSYISDLRVLVVTASNLLTSSLNVGGEAEVSKSEAEVLLANVQIVLSRLENEFNGTRIDTDVIRRNVNATLTLQLDLNLGQFYAVLMEINVTIKGLLFMFPNVSEAELVRRANVSLQGAEEALRLITEVFTRFSQLQTQYMVVVEDFNEAGSQQSIITSLLANATVSLNETELALNDSQESIVSSREFLSDLLVRLDGLRVEVEENTRNAERARTLTSRATDASLLIKSDAELAEDDLERLDSESTTKLEQSERELEQAINIRNATCRLQERAQEQLLAFENFVRIENALLLEQQVIKVDIKRVTIEVEFLDRTIQQHILRNTICLDSRTLSKKRKRRRRKKRNIS